MTQLFWSDLQNGADFLALCHGEKFGVACHCGLAQQCQVLVEALLGEPDVTPSTTVCRPGLARAGSGAQLENGGDGAGEIGEAGQWRASRRLEVVLFHLAEERLAREAE